MVIVFFWLLFSTIVAGAADRRGRSGFGWLLLAIAISPLLAGLLVLAIRQPDDPPVKQGPKARPIPPRPKKTIFEPDGEYGGIRYKVSEAGAVEVMLASGRVRFRNMEQFLALAIKNRGSGQLAG